MSWPLSTSLILISALAWGSAAQTYPATVEFDLVWPRNDTFAPPPVMPLVFAIQNPIATVALPFAIEWTISQYEGGGLFFGNTFTPSWANYSTDPDPLYIYTWTTSLNSSEGVFTFTWVLHSGNCSSSGIPNTNSVLGGMATQNNVMFTLQKGAAQQNLVQSLGKCPLPGPTFNVTSTLPVANTVDFSFDTTCAVLAPKKPPPNPCAVQVNDTVASSISSRVTYSACTTPVVPFGTAPPALTSGCPAPSSSNSLAVRSNLGGLALSGVVARGSLLNLAILGIVWW